MCLPFFFSFYFPLPRAVDVNRFTDKRKRIPEISSFENKNKTPNTKTNKKNAFTMLLLLLSSIRKGVQQSKDWRRPISAERHGSEWTVLMATWSATVVFFLLPPACEPHTLSLVCVGPLLSVCVCVAHGTSRYTTWLSFSLSPPCLLSRGRQYADLLLEREPRHMWFQQERTMRNP